MSKIRLNVESLAVDSFATDESARERGTVEAQQVTTIQPTVIQTCARKNTYYNSCYALCECTDRFRACLL